MTRRRTWVPLCWRHDRAYDAVRLELLPNLDPHWRDEVAHAVVHLGLIGAVTAARAGTALSSRRKLTLTGTAFVVTVAVACGQERRADSPRQVTEHAA